MLFALLFILNSAQAGHPMLFKQATGFIERVPTSNWEEALNELDSLQSKFGHTYTDFIQWGERLHSLKSNVEFEILKELFGKVGRSDFKKELAKCGIISHFEPDINFIKEVCKSQEESYKIVKLVLSDLVKSSKDCSLVAPKFRVNLDKAYDDFLLSPVSFLEISKRIDEDEDNLVIIVDTEESQLMLQSSSKPVGTIRNSPTKIANPNPLQRIIDEFEKDSEGVCGDFQNLVSKMVELGDSGHIIVNKISFA